VKHYYKNVPGLGNVAVSRHAQDRIREDAISDKDFEDALFNGETIPDTHAACFRDKNGIRLVIVHRPEPFRGAKLVTTAFRKEAQRKAG
jgi:hypothetical protein